MSFNKKVLSLVLSFLLLFVALPLTDFSAYATDPSDFGYNIISDDDKTAEIDSYNGDGGDVVIPSVIDGYTIVSISDLAFDFDDADYSITSLTIPSTVSYIEEFTFYLLAGCSSYNVEAGNMYYSSVDGVLYNNDETVLIRYPVNKSSDTFNIADTVLSIDCGAVAFSTFTRIAIPNGVEEVLDYAFAFSENLVEVYMSSSVEYLGVSSFDSCYSLSSVILSCNLTEIPEYAFYYCSSLSNIVIPASISDISSASFRNSSLTTVYGDVGTYAEEFADAFRYSFVTIDSLTVGDLYEDGLVNESDLCIMMDIATCITNSSSVQFYLGDVNSDGIVDGFDIAEFDRRIYA